MFKLVKNLEVDWPVSVKVPIDGGSYETQSFTGRFRVVDVKTAAKTIYGHEDWDKFLADVVVGWSGISSEKGDDLPFSPETRDALARIQYVRDALLLAYEEIVAGGAKRKN